ncbi:DUF2304 domain-containing protein [Leifsonia poae]|uniref:DUF2304 domain-containing protein n=1 Tax=Leifsonia poae TaxID=110933 RepID=A0A9W6H8R7_9MICO|nr:DUF2304 domain-containing protein [Leifsonia poae]GLJ75573.1 hypothetical protein GCM10017584_11470 [Leifsonia poae]
MDTGQLTIKIILIIVLAAFAIFLILPGRGVRHLAIRRLVMLLLVAVVVLAVIFPSAVTAVARVVGVGRGTDLLLYGLIVVFVGNSILQQRRHRHTEREITELARQLAILQAPRAGDAFPDVAEGVAEPVVEPVVAPIGAAGQASVLPAAETVAPSGSEQTRSGSSDTQRPIS